MDQVKVPGDQISKGRKQIIYRGIDILLNKNIDWDTHDLLITAVPKSLELERILTRK